MQSNLRRTRWAAGAMALAAGFSVGATSMASADPVQVVSTRRAPAGLAHGDAYMGWRSESADRTLPASPTAVPSLTRSSVTAAASPATGVLGIDVSRWQGTVDWAAWKARGTSFAYIKATEGKSYRNRYFAAQYTGSYKVGMIRGAYHYALPNSSGGKSQAKYFVAHGGGWSKDGRTLPGVLDIEYNPYGSTCYGKSKKQMVSWVKAFTKQYKKSTGRDAVIYTNLDWWSRCTGNSKAFAKSNPLWVARYASAVGTLPGGWKFYTFWQYKITPLDQDRFSGSRARLVALAKG